MTETSYLPQYMERIKDRKPVGTLEAEMDSEGKRVVRWKVTASPGVIQNLKRIFPGSEGQKGVCMFYNNKRICEDLNWAMIRYPLEIKDVEQWEKAYMDAVEHVVKRKKFDEHPDVKMEPAAFIGELKDFQKEGLSYLCNAERVLLADEMGLGKTVQALAFLAEKNAYPAVIVVPPHLVKNWEKEIKKFLRLPLMRGQQISLFENEEDRTVHIIKGTKPYELPTANVYIIHYLLLSGWIHTFEDKHFEAVVFDEIQELRRKESMKYSAASFLAQNCKYCIGLSGTPIYNRGGEMWNVMNIIEYHCLGDWGSFTREWCYGYGNDVVMDPEALGDYLKGEGLMLRRLKSEVLKELPPKRRVVQTIDFDEGQYSGLIQNAVEKARSFDGIKDVMEKGRLTREIVNDSRKAIGIAKAPYVVEFVKMLMEAGEKVLLFAYHHSVFDIYQDGLKKYNPVEITGRQSTAQKQESERKFMEGETDICIISLRAAAGLNLYRADIVVFGELDWSPAVHTQAEDRTHRIGATSSKLCYYLVAEEGTDETIQEFLGLKVSQFNGIMGDGGESEKDKVIAQAVATEHMKKVVEKLKNR